MSAKTNPYLVAYASAYDIATGRAYASALGKSGGSSKSEKKAAASRRNGKKGGAPKGNTNACKKLHAIA